MIRKNQEKRGRNANLLKICMFLVAILFFVGQVNAEIGVWCEGPNEDNITVCKSIDSSVVRPDGTAEVTLNVSWPVKSIKIKIPADVVLATDSSGSMRQNDQRGFRKTASKRFIDKMTEGDGKNYSIGLVSWDDRIDFSVPLTNNFNVLKEKIDTIDADGFTDLNVALKKSNELLDKSPRKTNPNINRVIILLTDGKQESPEGYLPKRIDHSIIEKAKNEGYKVYTIGLGSPENINESLLREIASETHGNYTHAENASALIHIYEKLAEDVSTETTTEIKDITVTDALHSYLKVKDNFTIPPTTGPSRNPDGTTTMVWGVKEEDVREVKKGDEEKKVWETSFDIDPDFNNLPIDVNGIYRALTHGTDDISIVNYTILGEPEPKSIDIPSGSISISCIPPSPPLGDFAILSPISIYLSPPNPAEGQKTTITATIQNIGRKNSGSFVVRFIADGNLIGEEHVEKGLESGEATTVETDWAAKKGVDITAKVDITSTSRSTQTPVKKPTPGFETIFAIAALLAVAYLVLRRRKA